VLTADLTWKPVAGIMPGDVVISFIERQGRLYLAEARVIAKVRHRRKRRVYSIGDKHDVVRAIEDRPWLIDERGRLLWASTRQVAERGYLLSFSPRPIGPLEHARKSVGELDEAPEIDAPMRPRQLSATGVSYSAILTMPTVNAINISHGCRLREEGELGQAREHARCMERGLSLDRARIPLARAWRPCLTLGGLPCPVEEYVEVGRDGYDYIYDVSTAARTFLADVTIFTVDMRDMWAGTLNCSFLYRCVSLYIARFMGGDDGVRRGDELDDLGEGDYREPLLASGSPREAPGDWGGRTPEGRGAGGWRAAMTRSAADTERCNSLHEATERENGVWVPRSWILRVLEHVRRFPQTTFFFLTKNPPATSSSWT